MQSEVLEKLKRNEPMKKHAELVYSTAWYPKSTQEKYEISPFVRQSIRDTLIIGDAILRGIKFAGKRKLVSIKDYMPVYA